MRGGGARPAPLWHGEHEVVGLLELAHIAGSEVGLQRRNAWGVEAAGCASLTRLEATEKYGVLKGSVKRRGHGKTTSWR